MSKRDDYQFEKGSLYGSMLMMSYFWPFAVAGVLLGMVLFPELWVGIAMIGWFAFNIAIQRFSKPVLLKISNNLANKNK